MHTAAYFTLLAGLFLSLALSARALVLAFKRQDPPTAWQERGQAGVFALLCLASVALLWALYSQEFSFAYVADYTDSYLPWYYALTAFWAGQDGSFLFWALAMAAMGFIFSRRPAYRALSPATKSSFWLFFFALQAFFLLLLTTISNPFVQLAPPPSEGQGLNPLLQHPGMIFHPPVLFLGYAGFAIPACLALAAGLNRDADWLKVVRNWVLASWTFLTAGIILGAWWSYMELGWGGYWVWDPVENASLIPWLTASGFLHTSMLGRRFQTLGRSNLFLAVLTLALCFVGTFLTRSGVLDSLHAFGETEVGRPLLVLIMGVLGVGAVLALSVGPWHNRRLAGFTSRQGLIVLLTWILLALSAIILGGTLYPVLSKLWSQNPIGLEQGFYNRVCLPLFTLCIVLLAVCPWLPWQGRVKSPGRLGAVAATLVLLVLLLWSQGLSQAVSLVAIGATGGLVMAVVLLLFSEPALRRDRSRLAAWGVHIGLGLVVLGVAVSGPYKVTREAVLDKGQSLSLQEYTLTYDSFRQYSLPGLEAYQARLTVKEGGKTIGVLKPERRMYRNFRQPFAEASVLPGLGDEIYATLLGYSQEKVIRLQAQVHPLVNWIWIGGVVMTCCGLLGLGPRGRRQRS